MAAAYPGKCCVRFATEIKKRRLAKEAVEREKHKAEKLEAWKRGRLPDGAQFAATYDASIRRWVGTLTTLVGGEPMVFTEKRRGVFTLMGCLDVKYREAVNAASPSADGEEPK